MGLFDLPGPLFTAIDAGLQALPALARLSCWAIITGAVSMLIYWLCSAQDNVSAAKTAALQARRALNGYDGHEFSEMWPLVGASLRNSGRHFMVVLGPALLGSLPALALIVWVSNTFGVQPPTPGLAVSVLTTPVIELRADTYKNQTIRYPSLDSTLVIRSADNAAPLVSLPTPAPAPVVHKRRWWNTLIGNPAGYLDAAAPVDEIRFGYAQQEFIVAGPAWMRGWELPFFALLILTSLGIKLVFRID